MTVIPPNDSPLAPSIDDHKDTLAKTLDTLVNIRAYANGVISTNLVSPSDPPPDWYAGLAANFATAVNHAHTWAQIEASIVSTVPQSLIDYGTTLCEVIDAILPWVKPPNIPTADQITQIGQSLGLTQTQLTTLQTNISTMKAAFDGFRTSSQTDFANFNSGANTIAKDIAQENIDIATLNGQIATTQATIKADQLAVDASAIAAGVGLVAGVSAMALGAETMGVGFIIGCFLVAGAVAALGTFAAYMVKLGEAQKELIEEQGELTADTATVVALTAIQSAVNNVIILSDTMQNALSAVEDWWTTVGTKLQSVINDVANADNATNTKFWLGVSIDLQTAQTQWTQLITYATNMQTMASTITDQKQIVPPPPVPSSGAQAA